MPEDQDQLYSGITETLKKHGIGLPATPTARPASEITAPPPKDNLLSGIHETLQKHGIAMAGVPPVAPVNQAPEPGTPPSAPVAPGVQPSVAGLKPPVPVETAPTAPRPVPFAPAPVPKEPEVVPGGFGGEERKPVALPEALAPTRAPEEPLAIRAFKEMGRFAATANKPVMDVVHGFARGLERAMDIPRRLVQGDWESETPHVLTTITGKAKELAAPEKLIEEAHPVGKFLGNLLGGLESYMIPGRMAAGAGYALPMATTMQKFGSNLLTFGSTDVFSTVGAGGSDEQVRDALLKSIPTAALFTIAQAIPINQLVKNPWLSKALESTATGTAFAGSHALGGETDPAALAVSFLTGFGLHTLTTGLPAKDRTQKAMEDHFNQYVIDWKETNKIKEAQWIEVQNILDRTGVGVPGEAEPIAKTPQPEAMTPEAQKEAIFGGALGETIEGQANRADAVRALVPQIGDQARAERFYDLYKEGDAATALKEFPEMSAWATEQQKVAQKSPEIPAPMPGAGGVRETAATSTPATEETRPAAATEMVSKGLSSVNPAGRSNEVVEALPKEAPPAPPRVTPAAPEPPSGAPAQAGGAGNVGLSPTPAEGPKKRGALVAPKPGLPEQPMGTAGSAKPESAIPEGVTDFMGKYGTARGVGAPDVGITPEPREWTPPAKRSRTYDFDRATELGDIDTMILASGGFDSKSNIFRDLEPEERKALFRYMRNREKFPTVKGPDVMFEDFKAGYPHLFPWETESDWLHALARGEHKKALMGDEIYAKMEAQNDYIAKKADSEGLSPEALARIEADVEREVASEEIAGRSAKPGEYDLEAGWPTPEETPTLRVGAPKPTALTARLDALEADYPGIDRDKAAQVIRALPNAEDGQVVNMAADPEMFAQVARGNLAASEKAQLLKKASDAGAQGALPGMGGGGTLFKVGEEAAFTRALTTDQIKGRLGKGGNVFELGPESYPANSPYTRGWMVATKEGHQIMIQEAKDGSLKMGLAGNLGPDYAAMGITSMEGKRIAGAFTPGNTPFGLTSFIEVAKGEGPRTLDHELWHAIERFFLTPKELAKVAKKYGATEEERAFAYEEWKPKETPDTVFQKIQDFFKTIIKALTGYTSAEDVFAAARKGELFGRKPVERGLPGALVAPKYRAAGEGGEWGMEGGIASRITGNARVAREEGKAAKNWLMNLFASNRTSREALKTHQIIAGSQAESATEKLRMQNVFMKYVDGMGPIKGEATQEFLRLYESGQEAQVTHPLFKAFGEEFRAEERRHMEIMTMLGDAPKEIPNYIDHLWKQNEAAEQIKAQLMSQISGGRSMRGPDYWKMMRTVVDIPTGIAAGLEPKFDTLPEMVLAGRSARENRIAATKRLTFIKENGYEKVVRDLDGGTYTVADAQGNDQKFKSINEARRFVADNSGSSDPRFEPDVPQGWKVYPGGYGEVWAKIKRRAGAMVPEKADEETMPLGGSPERMGYEEVPKVNAWSRVGYRVGPEDVVRQFEDFLGRGLSGNTAFEGYQSGLHAIRHSQMALSFFHAFFESINSVATHAGGGIFDSLGGLFTGDWRRAAGGLKALAASPLAPITDIRLGFDINKTLMENGIGIPGEATNNQLLKDARTLVGGGMRPEVESKLVKILSNHFKEAWKLKGVSTGKAANELLQGLSSPTMEVIVPFSKQGSTMFNYLAEVKRWERDNPGVAPTEADLRSIAYQCRETSDHIYGRMAKDNVAMNGMVKSLLTGVLQFPTWQFGTVSAGVRTVLGAKTLVGKVFDMMQGREIRQLAMKDRQVLQYVTGVLFTVGMTGALMTYALTGKKPETMADYFFPKTGEVNPNGSEERLQLPSYFKDAMGFTHHPFKTIGAKLASPIHILTDLIQNKDYWGTQIYDPHDWIGQRGVDVLKYMAKTTAPFALQSYEQGAKGGPGRFAMSLLGVRPVPRETANTPAQNVIDEYNQLMRASTTTKESAEKKKLKSDLMKMAREQDEAGFKEATDQAVSEGKMTRQQVKEIKDESQMPPGISRFTGLPLEWALRTWDKASDYEKEQWQPYFLKKVMAEKPENLIKNRDAVVEAMTDMGLTEAADAITSLTMPEETEVDLTGLGLLKSAPEMSGMEAVDAAIAAGLEAKLKGKVKRVSAMVRPPSTREKKKPYNVLGL